ncbi:MAG: hypothetical protein ACXWJB_08185, partial [Limisphaerales bacterium]
MSFKAFTKGSAIGLAVFLSVSALGTTRYVDLNGPSPASPYTNWLTAATNIQDAVDASVNGDTVLVTNGIYATGGMPQTGYALTNRVMVNKSIAVQSINGPSVTFIQGYQVPGTVTGDSAVRCVFLGSGAMLCGFTVTNGATRGASGDPKGEQPGGGVLGASSLSVISNCVLTGNAAYFWGGAAYGGSLYNCVIKGNAGSSGGGTYLCNLYNCVIVSNTASSSGGGATRGSLNNCTVVGNSAASYGGGFDGSSDGTLNNCIVYFNTAPTNANYYRGTFKQANSINYCCTVPYTTNGFGNITNDPALVSANSGGYHLQSNSPCINAGKNSYVTNAP